MYRIKPSVCVGRCGNTCAYIIQIPQTFCRQTENTVSLADTKTTFDHANFQYLQFLSKDFDESWCIDLDSDGPAYLTASNEAL